MRQALTIEGGGWQVIRVPSALLRTAGIPCCHPSPPLMPSRAMGDRWRIGAACKRQRHSGSITACRCAQRATSRAARPPNVSTRDGPNLQTRNTCHPSPPRPNSTSNRIATQAGRPLPPQATSDNPQPAPRMPRTSTAPLTSTCDPWFSPPGCGECVSHHVKSGTATGSPNVQIRPRTSRRTFTSQDTPGMRAHSGIASSGAECSVIPTAHGGGGVVAEALSPTRPARTASRQRRLNGRIIRTRWVHPAHIRARCLSARTPSMNFSMAR